jgi:hypothetical protein
MESNDGPGLGGGGAPKRSSYEGAEGAGVDLGLGHADPEGAAMGAALPCGRRPKSRARRPWKSSMATRIGGSDSRSHNRGTYAARRSEHVRFAGGRARVSGEVDLVEQERSR